MGPIPKRDDSLVLKGTVTVFRRRCGKATCRCATGDPHESPALVYTENGRTKTVTLWADEVTVVEAAVARYSQARDDLDVASAAGLVELREQRDQRSRP